MIGFFAYSGDGRIMFEIDPAFQHFHNNYDASTALR